MNAAEIMTKEVVTARPDTSIGEIADLLLNHKITAVPVIDDDRHVVGIVSQGDLLARARGGCGSLATIQSAWRRLRPPAV